MHFNCECMLQKVEKPEPKDEKMADADAPAAEASPASEAAPEPAAATSSEPMDSSA